MTFLSKGFNAKEVAPSTGFDPIPAGEYRFVIEKMEEKATKTGGLQIVVQAAVVEGQPCAGRKLFDRFNVECPSSAKAEEIGKAQFSALCHAVGILEPKDYEQFVGRTAVGKVRVVKRQDNGEMENAVGWKVPTAEGAAAPPKAGDKKPWER